MDFRRFHCLTFDCYGTLVDWETGLFGALRPVLAAHGVKIDDAKLLEHYAELEAHAEAGEYKRYRDVLREVVLGLGKRLAFTPTPAEADALADSIPQWLPFPDTVAALRRLHKKYQLAIISNIDDDLFAHTARRLEVPFDHVITAEQARSYKPSRRNFELAIERIGLPPEQILHVAQSIFHDVVPASSLGFATVWVNRPSPRAGAGATPAAKARPDLEVPDLNTLAEMG
jgi:2-haloacid dehalogenase